MDATTILPARSVEDILAQRVRLVVGDGIVDLPVRSIEANEAWKMQLDAAMTSLLDRTSDESPGAILTAMAGSSDPFFDLLEAYDTEGALPPRAELRKMWTELDLMVAVLEVWRAANPLVDIGLAVWTLTTTSATRRYVEQRRMSESLRNTAGQPVASAAS